MHATTRKNGETDKDVNSTRHDNNSYKCINWSRFPLTTIAENRAYFRDQSTLEIMTCRNGRKWPLSGRQPSSNPTTIWRKCAGPSRTVAPREINPAHPVSRSADFFVCTADETAEERSVDDTRSRGPRPPPEPRESPTHPRKIRCVTNRFSSRTEPWKELTFVVNAQIVLGQSDVVVLFLGAPGAGQRRLFLVHGGVKSL